MRKICVFIILISTIRLENEVYMKLLIYSPNVYKSSKGQPIWCELGENKEDMVSKGKSDRTRKITKLSLLENIS